MNKMVPALAALVLCCGCIWVRFRLLEQKAETVSVLRYRLQTTIARPVKDVFDLIRAWNTYAVDYARYSEVSSHGLTGVGTYSKGQANLAGRKVKWNEVVVEFQEDRVVRLVYGGDMRGTLKMEVEPVGEKTRYSFTGHIFFLPDSILSRTLNAFLEQGILGDYLDQSVTAFLVKDLARLENKDPKQMVLDAPPTHEVFVDAYYKAQETLPKSPQQVFRYINSVSGLQTVLPVDRIEPVGDSPAAFSKLGNHYRVTATTGLETPLVYDMVVVQLDPPTEARYYLYAHNAGLEIDLLVRPAPGGSKVLMLFILDLPEAAEGQDLEVLIQTSHLDKAVQEALTNLKQTWK